METQQVYLNWSGTIQLLSNTCTFCDYSLILPWRLSVLLIDVYHIIPNFHGWKFSWLKLIFVIYHHYMILGLRIKPCTEVCCIEIIVMKICIFLCNSQITKYLTTKIWSCMEYNYLLWLLWLNSIDMKTYNHDIYLCGVGTNSGMDYWNGTLDWTTGLNYFPFLDKFLCYFKRTLTFSEYKF